MFSIRRRIAAVGLSLIAGTIGVTSPAIADGGDGSVGSTPQGTAFLTGTVTGAPDGLAGAWVTAYSAAHVCDPTDAFCPIDWAADGTVDPATGAFSISVPENGMYYLQAAGDGFYPNSYGRTPARDGGFLTGGTPVSVGTDDVSALDIAVIAKPLIRGTITLPAEALSNPALGDYQDFLGASSITVYRYESGSPDDGVDPYWSYYSGKTFGADELSTSLKFAMPVLAGTYRVKFTNYWTGPTFYGGTTLETATDIVADGDADVTGIDLAPTLLPTISGTVTAPEGETIDPQLFVVAVPFTPGDDGTPVQDFGDAAYAVPGADGAYRLPVTPGSYAVIALSNTQYGFYGPEPACFAEQGLDKGCYPTRVSVDNADASNIDFAMRLFPRFVGTITLPEGVDISGIRVSAEKWITPDPGSCDPDFDMNECADNWIWVSSAALHDNGDGTASYKVSMKEPGTYRLTFGGDRVEYLAVGGDEAPDADAFELSTLTFIEVVRDVTLTLQPMINGTVNPDIFGDAGFVSAWVMLYAVDEEGFTYELGDYPVDEQNMTFDIPTSAGDYSAVLYWTTQDEYGNERYHKAYLGGGGIFTVMAGKSTSIAFDGTPPSAPTSAEVLATGDGAVTVGWSASESDGGSDITGYSVTAIDAASGATTEAMCEAAADETSCTVEGLDNLHEYSFAVTSSNEYGDSDAVRTDLAVPHTDGFTVWVNQQTVIPGAQVRVWALGAQSTDTVSVKVGADFIDMTPSAYGDSVVNYVLEDGTSAVRSGKVRVYAKALRTTDTGRTKRFNAKTTIYLPKTKMRGTAREGGTITARVSATAPDSMVSIGVYTDEGYQEMCSGTSDRFGRLACTFDAPEAGTYAFVTAVNQVLTTTNTVLVKPARVS